MIATRLFAPEVSAASARLRWLARAFVSAGLDVRVLTTSPPSGSAPAHDPAGVRVSRFPVLRDSTGAVRGYVQYLSFDAPLLLRLLLSRRPDIVVCEPPPTTGFMVRLVCGLWRVPYAYYAADVWTDGTASAGAPGWVVATIRRVESWVLRGACLVLSVSDGVSERLLVLGVDPGRIRVVGNGVDTEVYTAEAASDIGSEIPDVPYAVYAGTMSEWQGADVFVRGFAAALDRLPDDARLVFLGQGSGLPQVQRLAAELAPGRVDVVGVVPPAQAARWQRSAVCALVSIVPGQGYDFARPTKVWAATACGTPVLFAGIGSAAEQVREAGLGEAVAHDPVAVGEALVRAFGAGAPSSGRRAQLVEWTHEHASLARVSADAVDGVLTAAGLGR